MLKRPEGLWLCRYEFWLDADGVVLYDIILRVGDKDSTFRKGKGDLNFE